MLQKQYLKSIVIILFLLIGPVAFAQETKGQTYEFINAEKINDIDDYEKALSTANMSKFRYLNKSNIIMFENGLKVKLFSGKKLIANGHSFEKTKLLTTEPSNKDYYIFGISQDKKYIMQKFTYTKLK